jgi:hypothetical protein
MATPKKRAADKLSDLAGQLGRARSKLAAALEKLADTAEDKSRTEVRTSRGGRTVTVINRGTTISRPKKRG